MPKIKTPSGDNLPTSDGTKSNYPQAVTEPSGEKLFNWRSLRSDFQAR